MPDAVETIPIRLKVNGKSHSLTIEPRLLLVELLREHLDLTGTHVGCDTTYCGAYRSYQRRRCEIMHGLRRAGGRRRDSDG